VAQLQRSKQEPEGGDDPDALYAKRETPGQASRAHAIWQARLARNASDFESAWKASRASYWLGNHDVAAERRAHFERGIDEGRKAAAIKPGAPDGYFWLAANMGALAEGSGMSQGLKYRKPIKEALERALAIDPSYLGGAPDRALGRWYSKVPGLFGGSDQKAVEHLRRALTYNPQSTVTHFFLAETLLELKQRNQAAKELQAVIDVPLDPAWAPEDREWKSRAKTLLGKIQ
jgi:tetratricopeptide (TPR) repeat protein